MSLALNLTVGRPAADYCARAEGSAFAAHFVARRLLSNMAIISKITSKGQTTVPREVRGALHSRPGDLLAWDVDANGRVGVRRVQPLEVEHLEAVEKTMSEWRSAEDEAAYGDL